MKHLIRNEIVSPRGLALGSTSPMQFARGGALPAAAAPVIECQSLWKLFGTERLARQTRAAILSGEIDRAEALERHHCVVSVRDVSFSVQRGEIFCVMGMSGSGKSTLIRHINRLIEPSSGEILIDGQSIRGLGARELRLLRADRIGMVFQNMALLPHRSVQSNVSLSLELKNVDPRERARTVARVLDIVGLAGWGERYPAELSGGMQQRVGLARALAADPEILLMDEPFSALDPLTRRQLQDEFRGLSRQMNKTTVFITHDLDEAMRIGDRIAIMKDGAFVQVGTPEEIVMRPADDFVADFVKGISRTHLITAQRLMVSPEHFIAASGFSREQLETLAPAQPDTSLCDLILQMAQTQTPIAVRHGKPIVGVVTSRVLFEALHQELLR